MESYDVLIVGGGPAGSTCAWRLQQVGLRTAVIDKKAFPRDKPCAGWITPQVVESLALSVEEYRQGRTWQPLTGFRCGVIGGADVEIRYDRPISYGIRRFEFDEYLLARCGAEQRLGQPLGSLERRGGQWIVNREFQAPMLIGAGGNFCPVARHLGARDKGRASVVVAQEIEFKAEPEQLAAVAADTPILYFCRDLLGYGWCFRKGDYLNVGLGRTEKENLAGHIAEFREFLASKGIASGKAGQAWKGHAYQLYDHVAYKLFDDGVLLIGDAAGLAYAQSGEGIRPAVESALIAADVVVKAGGSYSADQLASYQSRLQARLGKPRRAGMLAHLPAAWLHSLAARLLATEWFSRQVVMDKWFLHRREAALVV